ncbi:hypothetical protein M9434_006936 [Picochlorum sp. BPE23]|nr:hypothetical protein M9434_006936 [Picochlorum sp. BPE23]
MNVLRRRGLEGLYSAKHNLSKVVFSKRASTAHAAEQYAAEVKKVSCRINGHDIIVPEGTTILGAATNLGQYLSPFRKDLVDQQIFIPTLCTDPRLPTHPGTCRLCLVEVNGRLVPACATPLTEHMDVVTDTDQVQKSVRDMLGLLKSTHKYDCMNCEVSGNCEFQDLIKRYNVSDGFVRRRQRRHEWDDEEMHDSSSASLEIDLDKCIKCGRCITACNMIQHMNVLGWEGRAGGSVHPAVMTDSLNSSQCIACGQCSAVCPVGAIIERSEWRDVLDVLDSKRKVTVCITAPAVRVSIGEEVGFGPGAITQGQMVAAQRKLGFDYVFDVNFAADLTIMEEGSEFIQRMKEDSNLPMFTSCCPAWITLVEKSYPELIPHISTCKSPQQMLGAIAKRYFASLLNLKAEDICLVSIMPCTAKKFEAEREENKVDGITDVDYVLTTRELGKMLRHRRIPLASLPESSFDSPLGMSSGGAVLFGASGGVMESALRTSYELITKQPFPKMELDDVRGVQGVKSSTVHFPEESPLFPGKDVRVAVVSGIGNVRHVIDDMYDAQGQRKYDFIEVMACIGGCIGGGGQPKSKDPQAVLKRMGSIYALDKMSKIRRAHENPEVAKLYEKFLGQPGGHTAHTLLHTSYTDRTAK